MHLFAVRHVVVELQELAGASRSVSVIAAFAISAVAHEIIFSVAFKTLRPFFFLGMLAQLPLMAIQCGHSLRGRRRGNMVVWASIFIGQPMLELLYVRDWYVAQQACPARAP